MKQPKRSPWGPIQQWEILANGIASVSTASHGGIKLDRSRQASMPKALAVPGGWYEEDLDYVRVILAFPDNFAPEEIAHADVVMRQSYPDDYEAWSGKTVSVEESQVRWWQVFNETHRDDYVVEAAWGNWHESVPKGSVGVFAKRKSDNDTKYFLVPQAEYAARNGAFVVDTKRHQSIKPLS